MSFPISPAVAVREIDLTLSAVEEISSLGAFAGQFDWGPIGVPTLVSNETDLVNRFGFPTNKVAQDFFTIASFFAYTSGAYVVRINPTGNTFNAGFPAMTGADRRLVENSETYDVTQLSGYNFIAKCAGERGNSLAVITCASSSAFATDIKSIPGITFALNFGGSTPIRSRVIPYSGTASAATYFNAGAAFGDFLIVDGVNYRVIAIDDIAKTITLDRTYVGRGVPQTIRKRWLYADLFNRTPSSNSMHAIVIDVDGKFSGAKLTVLEQFANISLNSSAVSDSGVSLFWRDVFNTQSKYVFAGGLAPTQSGVAAIQKFSGGSYDSSSAGVDDYITGYSHFSNSTTVNAPLIIAGNAIKNGEAILANYLVESIAEVRKDCLVFLSPAMESVVNNRGEEVDAVVDDRYKVTSSSYATMDSGWKYMYDKYNDVFRWVPLNGDHAGLYARVDRERETWVSAAGSSKGQIKNVVKLAWSPDQTQRDALYINDVNPVTILPVAGPVMYGDKTLLGVESAFSRINVRRLFIILEKTIATAANSLLFEFNDEFTQRRFVSIVEPFLRNVKGRRGITDFKVVADNRVNTPEVIQANRFVGQVFVKPNYSINFIRLDFVAVGNSASFDEVIGSI